MQKERERKKNEECRKKEKMEEERRRKMDKGRMTINKRVKGKGGENLSNSILNRETNKKRKKDISTNERKIDAK